MMLLWCITQILPSLIPSTTDFDSSFIENNKLMCSSIWSYLYLHQCTFTSVRLHTLFFNTRNLPSYTVPQNVKQCVATSTVKRDSWESEDSSFCVFWNRIQRQVVSDHIFEMAGFPSVLPFHHSPRGYPHNSFGHGFLMYVYICFYCNSNHFPDKAAFTLVVLLLFRKTVAKLIVQL